MSRGGNSLLVGYVCFIQRCFILAAVVLGLFFPIWAFAQSSSVKLDKPESQEQTSTVKIPEASSGNSKINGYVRFEGTKYPTKIPESPNLDQSLLLSTNLRFDGESPTWHNAFDVTAGKYLDLGGSTYAIREMQTTYKKSENFRVSAGRKIEYWSKVDQDWNLGLWQPSYVIDGLRPEEQGLTGFFLDSQMGDLNLLLFATPLFIPTMGPDIQAKNGSLVSDSRWYRQPSSTFPLRGQDTKLVYGLEVPDMGELIFNGGAGVRASVGRESKGFWTSFNAGVKPVNSLLLKYKTNLYLPEEDLQTGEVTVSPAVGYHTIRGADFGYQFETANLTFSYLEDTPLRQKAKDNWVLQSPNPMNVYGVHFGTRSKIPFVFEAVEWKLNYLKILGGEIKDYDALGQEQGAIFENRTNFTNAASVELGVPTFVYGKRLLSKFKYMREFEQSGIIMSTEFNYFPRKDLALTLGADVLGPDDTKLSNNDTRFINQFRANDRYFGGLSYVF